LPSIRAGDADHGEDDGAAPEDVAGTSMPSEVGESIDRDGERTGADRHMRL